MIETRLRQMTLRSELLRSVRVTMDEVFAIIADAPDAGLYAQLRDDWDDRLTWAMMRNPEMVVSPEIVTAVEDLMATARSAVDLGRGEDALADWLELLPQSALSLTEVHPSLAARLSEPVWPRYERLTNSLDARHEELSRWDTETEQSERPVVAA